MFDFTQILEIAKVEPGSGMLQSILLFMIWIQSRGIRKEIANLQRQFNTHEQRFQNHEFRLVSLENKKGG